MDTLFSRIIWLMFSKGHLTWTKHQYHQEQSPPGNKCIPIINMYGLIYESHGLHLNSPVSTTRYYSSMVAIFLLTFCSAMETMTEWFVISFVQPEWMGIGTGVRERDGKVKYPHWALWQWNRWDGIEWVHENTGEQGRNGKNIISFNARFQFTACRAGWDGLGKRGLRTSGWYGTIMNNLGIWDIFDALQSACLCTIFALLRFWDHCMGILCQCMMQWKGLFGVKGWV